MYTYILRGILPTDQQRSTKKKISETEPDQDTERDSTQRKKIKQKERGRRGLWSNELLRLGPQEISLSLCLPFSQPLYLLLSPSSRVDMVSFECLSKYTTFAPWALSCSSDVLTCSSDPAGDRWISCCFLIASTHLRNREEEEKSTSLWIFRTFMKYFQKVFWLWLF